ncbi:hypothetical protein PIROE2DRAFT_14648 [Piromyces sp. E2]|nr:hypothetical protein PIROE2DRAFT_14648 [Piromyces sp. E2]|eukprot:OUM59745.1 hypothetical protein PIROE2DRAFT_14648 [Piromyces sp. E2]
MGLFDSIWEPESFFGITDLKTGALILGFVNLVFSLYSLLKREERKFGHYLSSLAPVIFSILFVIAIVSEEVLKKLKFTKSVAYIIFITVFLLENLYTWRVVNAYHKEMKENEQVSKNN